MTRALLLVLATAACGDKYARICEPIEDEITYAEVAPLFAEHCVRCHAASKSRVGDRHGAPKGVDFVSYEAAIAHAESADAQVASGQMPNDAPGKMTDAESCLIAAWISQGLKE